MARQTSSRERGAEPTESTPSETPSEQKVEEREMTEEERKFYEWRQDITRRWNTSNPDSTTERFRKASKMMETFLASQGWERLDNKNLGTTAPIVVFTGRAPGIEKQVSVILPGFGALDHSVAVAFFDPDSDEPGTEWADVQELIEPAWVAKRLSLLTGGVQNREEDEMYAESHRGIVRYRKVQPLPPAKQPQESPAVVPTPSGGEELRKAAKAPDRVEILPPPAREPARPSPDVDGFGKSLQGELKPTELEQLRQRAEYLKGQLEREAEWNKEHLVEKINELRGKLRKVEAVLNSVKIRWFDGKVKELVADIRKELAGIPPLPPPEPARPAEVVGAPQIEFPKQTELQQLRQEVEILEKQLDDFRRGARVRELQMTRIIDVLGEKLRAVGMHIKFVKPGLFGREKIRDLVEQIQNILTPPK